MTKRFVKLAALCALLALTAGCGEPRLLNPQKPVTITMWHTYVEQMKTGLDTLVNEFNSTIGAETGIVVNITAVSNASVLNEKLLLAANDDPGAPALPDMAVIYPRIAIELAKKGILADMAALLTPGELAAFVPRFLDEGKLGGHTLYLLPIAKSTEVLYINTTIFDRFSNETGVTLGQLATFEGIMDASERYYSWTDAKTPEIANDGKTFYYPDALFNFFLIGYAQLGEDFLQDQSLNLSAPAFERLWNCYYPGAVTGRVAIFDDYGNYLAKTGDIVCTTSTSAGVLFYPDTVTYADNTKEKAEYAILPYPVLEGGRNVAVQRGGGVCIVKSSPEKEHAAGIFLKWLTAAAQNLRFTTSMGYLPVTESAFEQLMTGEQPDTVNQNIGKMLATASQMQNTYDFHVPPVFDGIDALQSAFVEALLKKAEADRDKYRTLLDSEDADTAYAAVSRGAMQSLIDMTQMTGSGRRR